MSTSFVTGNDSLTNWGMRPFFVYYSSPDTTSTAFEACLEMATITLVFFASILLNVTMVLCVFRFPDMKSVTNSYVLNLAAADILFTLTMPVVAYARTSTSWELGGVACKALPFLQFLSAIVLMWTLTLISVDRYCCIMMAPQPAKVSSIRAYVNCALSWLLAGVILTPLLVYFRVQTTVHPGRALCTIALPPHAAINYAPWLAMPLVVVAFHVPMVILCCNYQRIFLKVLSTKSTWATSCVMVSTAQQQLQQQPLQTTAQFHAQQQQIRRQSEVSLTEIFVPWPARKSSNSLSNPNGRHGSLTQHEEQRLNKHIKCVRVLLLNVGFVLTMWLPLSIFLIILFVDEMRAPGDTEYGAGATGFIVTLIIAFLNTIINPVLYGVLSDSFRASMLKILCLRRECASDSGSGGGVGGGAGASGNPAVIMEHTVTPSSGQSSAPGMAFANFASAGFPRTDKQRKQSLLNSMTTEFTVQV